ncbi:MAG: helix-turn-helix domain-containing protein [Methanosarcinaceae archaeon]|nr:helix-turn-helix domain-containing protein [Methanosarcinaceae archaeon]
MEKQLLNAILALGLTHKEAQAYHALVTKGVMTAEDISKLIEVQHPIVYRTLQGLKDKGWIDSTTDRPKKYRAKQPKIAAENAGKRQIAVINGSIELIDQILSPQYNESQEMLRQEIWTVRGQESVIHKISEMGARTRHKVFGKVTGPIDDDTFNEIFTNIPPAIALTVQIMGPPIIDIDPKLEKRIQIYRPYFEGKCRTFPMELPSANAKDEFLKKVHGSRFISIHLLFDEKEALWINIPYKDNVVVKEKVWANWIIDPDYIEIVKTEV